MGTRERHIGHAAARSAPVADPRGGRLFAMPRFLVGITHQVYHHRVFAIAGAITALFLMLLAVLPALFAFDPKLSNTVPAYSEVSEEVVDALVHSSSLPLLVAAIAFSIWGVSVYLRCLDYVLRRRLVAVATICTLWMIEVILKYKSFTPFYATVLWYLYYVPMTLIPLLYQLCGLRLAGLEQHRLGRRYCAALWIVAILLIGFVLTNDFHQQVFRFDRTSDTWSNDYTYGWGYFAVLGVRTESWTAGRSGLEVRMYSREKVELFLLATEDGMGPTAAAKFAGVSVGAAKKWATGHLPHSYTGARCRIGARKPPRKEASLGPDKSIYAPPATGPLAGLNEDQIENLLLRAVLADLKAEGWDPASISNRSKCELGERLRRATALPLRSITGFLRISKSSYEYWRPRVAAPRDRDADIRDRVVRIFREGSGCWGYRTVWARLRREGVRASEKRVARVMREEGLEVVYNKRRARGYSSYAGEVSKAPENLVNRRFRADEPNRLWLTDITEFRLPGGEKVYLSPIVDCFDGMPVAWSIGLHPDKRLANSSLLKACAARPAGARTTIHSDRGGHYRWPEWIGICEENGLVRSMSAKGCSPDNSACEGFFGRLKNEFFHYRDWEGVTAEEFMGRLEAYLVYYREERIKKSLGWLSPMEYRRKLGYA
mgnify:CR=1 FL=1